MKPLCAVCGDRHESYQAHIWPKVVANVVVNAKPVVVNRKRDRHKDKEARRKYLAEYMRKRRARPS